MPKFKNDTRVAYMSPTEAASKIEALIKTAQKAKADFEEICSITGKTNYWDESNYYVPSTDRDEWFLHSSLRYDEDISEDAKGMWLSSSSYC